MRNVASQQACKVVIARNAPEVDTLRPAWRMLLEQEDAPVFNAEPDRFLALVAAQPDARPLAMLVMKDEEPVALLLGSITRTRVRCKIGYRAVSLPPLEILTIIHGGLLGRITDDVSEVLLEELKRLLKSAEVDAAFFHYLRQDSSLCKIVVSKTGGLCRSHFRRMDVHRTMRIPDSLESFYQLRSKKHRANLRRYVRRLDEQYGKRVVITRYAGKDRVGAFMEAASRVSERTYQYGLGSGMRNGDSQNALLEDMGQNGWLRGHVMFVDGEPCAFQYGAVYKGRFFLEQMGFDPAWRQLNVGTVLFLNALENLCDESVEVMDFGFGDAEYKRSYGDAYWMDTSFYVFAWRVRPILVNLVHSSATGLAKGAAHILGKMGLINRTKRLWRNRLQKKDVKREE